MDVSWTLSELVAEAAASIATLPAPRNGQVRAVPDERTVRYYGTLGLLDRPAAMRGRTALYGRKHLAQVVAIKRLQSAGRSLAEIQALWPTLDDVTLARMSGIELAPKGRAARREFWRRDTAGSRSHATAAGPSTPDEPPDQPEPGRPSPGRPSPVPGQPHDPVPGQPEPMPEPEIPPWPGRPEPGQPAPSPQPEIPPWPGYPDVPQVPAPGRPIPGWPEVPAPGQPEEPPEPGRPGPGQRGRGAPVIGVVVPAPGVPVHGERGAQVASGARVAEGTTLAGGAAAVAYAPVELRVELAPGSNTFLVVGLADDVAHTIDSAEVRAIRAAAAPLVAELARRGLIARPAGTLEDP